MSSSTEPELGVSLEAAGRDLFEVRFAIREWWRSVAMTTKPTD